MSIQIKSNEYLNELLSWPNSKLISIIKCSVIFGAVVYIVIGLYLYIAGQPDDLSLRWKEAGYWLNGYNPIAVANNGWPVLEKYGPMRKIDGYPPWSYVYAMILTSPLLSYQVVKVVFLIINILAIIALSFFIRMECCSPLCEKKQWLFLWASALCCLAVPVAFRHGQYGIIISVALWGFLYFEDKRLSFWSGLFLAFAFLKPQIGGLFFLLPLARKSFKTCFWCIMIILVTTAVAAWRCHTWPWTLLIDELNVGVLNDFYMGISDPLKYYIDKKLLLGLSVSICASISFLLLIIFRKAPIIHVIAIPAVFSTLWMSHRVHDLMVISLLVVPLISLSMRKRSSSLLTLSLLVGISYWTPHLARFYMKPQFWLIPLLVRILWVWAACFVLFSETMLRDRNNVGVSAPSTR